MQFQFKKKYTELDKETQILRSEVYNLVAEKYEQVEPINFDSPVEKALKVLQQLKQNSSKLLHWP